MESNEARRERPPVCTLATTRDAYSATFSSAGFSSWFCKKTGVNILPAPYMDSVLE